MTRVAMRRALAALALLAAACGRDAAPSIVPGGDVARGERRLAQYGCGSCHEIEGVQGAHGRVGPPLTGIASRSLIAGQLANTPANMVRWIMDPPALVPGTAMPSLVHDSRTARDMAAYLYTLR